MARIEQMNMSLEEMLKLANYAQRQREQSKIYKRIKRETDPVWREKEREYCRAYKQKQKMEQLAAENAALIASGKSPIEKRGPGRPRKNYPSIAPVYA